MFHRSMHKIGFIVIEEVSFLEYAKRRSVEILLKSISTTQKAIAYVAMKNRAIGA